MVLRPHGNGVTSTTHRCSKVSALHRHILLRLVSRPALFPAMVQSLNTKALVTLASVIRRPSLLVPHVSVPTISHLNYTALKECAGIRAVVFDKDNTLTAPYALAVHPDAVEGLQAAIAVFGTDNVAIFSNSAGTGDDPGYEDALRIEEALGIAVIRHNEKKPGGLAELLAHFKFGRDDGDGERGADGGGNDDSVRAAAASVCMVGDRLLTDVVFGNLNGMLSVHTLPLCRGDDNRDDNAVASVVRTAENWGLYGNWFGGRMLLQRRPSHRHWRGADDCPLTLAVAGRDEAPPSVR